MSSSGLLILTVIVIVAMTVLQFVPLVEVVHVRAADCFMIVSTDDKAAPPILDAATRTPDSSYRTITMWGRPHHSDHITYWENAAEPKTAVTSLVTLGAAVLLFISLSASPRGHDTAESLVTPSTTSSTEVNDVLDARELDKYVDGDHLADVHDGVRAPGAANPLCLVRQAVMARLLALITLIAAVWCLVTFNEKWDLYAGDRAGLGYFILLCMVLPTTCWICMILFFWPPPWF